MHNSCAVSNKRLAICALLFLCANAQPGPKPTYCTSFTKPFTAHPITVNGTNPEGDVLDLSLTLVDDGAGVLTGTLVRGGATHKFSTSLQGSFSAVNLTSSLLDFRNNICSPYECPPGTWRGSNLYKNSQKKDMVALTLHSDPCFNHNIMTGYAFAEGHFIVEGHR